MQTIIAFANAAGGRLVIGVDDDRSIIGLQDPLFEEEHITNLIADSISPRLVPGIDIIYIDEKTILVVDVPLSTSRPHFLSSQGKEKSAYVRLGSTNRIADSSLLAEIERSVLGLRFEDQIDSRAQISDLDLELLPPIEDQPITKADLVALGLAKQQGKKLIPTNAGLLAACPNPDHFFTSAWVQCGRIRGSNRTDISDRMEYHGPLLGAVEAVMDLLRKHAFLSAHFGEIKQKDVWSIPLEALREIVVNAVVHSNYAEPGTPIRIVFYDDSIEVESPGLLVAGMTIPEMRYASRLRNPSLARIFRTAGLMENYGTGIRRVYDQLVKGGFPDPKIEEMGDRIRVTVFIPSHASVPAQVNDRENHQIYEVLKLLSTSDLSRAEILASIGLANETRNVRRHLIPLLSQGLIALTIPKHPTSSQQRYQITDNGRALLTSISEQPL